MSDSNENPNTGGQMLEKYAEVFEDIIRIEKENESARRSLIAGESPYVSLSIIRNLAENAMSNWHSIRSQEGD
ncbi:MAG: hypothetical protein ACW99G_05095 [Candidatus Thorarchaeota archaeon]